MVPTSTSKLGVPQLIHRRSWVVIKNCIIQVMVGFVKLIMYNLLSGGYQSLDNLQQDSVLGYRSQSQMNKVTMKSMMIV